MNLELTNNELSILVNEILDALPKIDVKNGQLLKFRLSELLEKANIALTPFNKLKDEFLKLNAIKNEDGSFSIKQLKDETKELSDDNIRDEVKEFLELLKEKVEITYRPIPESYLEKLTSEALYPVLYKFIELI